MKKLSFILALIIALTGMIGLFAISVSAAEDAGYTYDEATNTYTVTTADGLVAVAAIITGDGTKGGGNYNANITLACDIDMKDTDKSWFPICDKSNILYVGTVDGQGHAIKNFNDTSKPTGARRGFIGRAGNCTVKNLTFIDPVVEGGKLTGVIIGDIRKEGNRPALTATDVVTIENCHIVNATVKSTSRENVGGFVGGNSTLAGLVIKNSTISANVAATKFNAGLLIGGEEGSDALNYTFENVVATGTLTVSTPNEGMEGSAGLIGGMDGATITMTNVITNVALVGADTNNTITLNNVNGFGFSSETVPAISSGLAHANIKTVIFADNAALRDAALALIPHEHVFNQEVATEAYLNAAATCTAKATYFLSCECLEAGTETFERGEMLPHTPGKTYNNDGAQHWVACTKCEAKLYSDHVYDQEVAGDEYLITPAGCTTRAEFFKSCKCGAKGEESFKAVGVLGHFWGEWTTAVEPTVDAEGVAEKVCATCGAKETKAIEKLPAPEAPAVEPGIIDQVKAMAGCGGSIGGASIIIMIAAAGAVVLRKKED